MKTLIVSALLLLQGVSFAEKIPDEKTPCYKQCLSERLACRKPCHKIKVDKKRYACLDLCDPVFNQQCVSQCPMKDND